MHQCSHLREALAHLALSSVYLHLKSIYVLGTLMLGSMACKPSGNSSIPVLTRDDDCERPALLRNLVLAIDIFYSLVQRHLLIVLGTASSSGSTLRRLRAWGILHHSVVFQALCTCSYLIPADDLYFVLAAA